MEPMSSPSSPVHPNAIVLVVVGLATAIGLGVRHSAWVGVAFGLAALVFVAVVNRILVRRERRGQGRG